MLFSTTEQVYKYFDSYSPFIKERVEGFVSAMKLVLIKKPMLQLKKIKGQKDIYAIGKDNKKHLILNFRTFVEGVNMGMWSADILEVDFLQEEDGNVIITVQNE